MPAFNNAIPALGRKYDLRDVVDHVDRLLEVAQQSATQTLGQIRSLIPFDPVTGVAGTPEKPGFVAAGADTTTYQTLLTNVDSTIAASGALQLAAALQQRLNDIAKLNSSYATILKTPIV